MTLGCKECGFTGIIEKDNKVFECQCSLNRRIAMSMPLNVRITTVIKEHAIHPIVNMIRKNLFVTAASDDMKAIAKVVIYKNSDLFIRITDDTMIRDVGVGATGRKARGDNADIVYNSLHEYVDPPALLIIELGRLGYKNKAAAGLLEEAISMRVNSGYIWLFSDKNSPFGPASHSYSEELWRYINSPIFEKIDIQRINKAESLTATAPTRHVESETSNLSVQKKAPNKSEDSENEKPKSSLDMFGSGNKKKKKYYDD
jgi:hypothetical protein